jgi:hypothetical protein
VRVRHAGHGIGDAGARDDDRHPEAAREPRPRVGGVRRRLLVPDVDDPDAGAQTGVVDGQDVAAAQREDCAHALAA